MVLDEDADGCADLDKVQSVQHPLDGSGHGVERQKVERGVGEEAGYEDIGRQGAAAGSGGGGLGRGRSGRWHDGGPYRALLDGFGPISRERTLHLPDARLDFGQEPARGPGAVDRGQVIATHRGVDPAGATAGVRNVKPPRNESDGRYGHDGRDPRRAVQGDQHRQPQYGNRGGSGGDVKTGAGGHYDGLNVAQVESLVLLAEAQGFDGEDVIGGHPEAGAVEESAALAGEFAVTLACWRGHRAPLNRPETRYTIPRVHRQISVTEIRMAATNRQRLRRTRLRGRLQVNAESTRLAGAAMSVKG